jgi:hypothetical protein
VRVGDQCDVAAVAAIATARAAARDILLSPKSKTAVAAVAGLYQDSRFVNEHSVTRALLPVLLPPLPSEYGSVPIIHTDAKVAYAEKSGNESVRETAR